MSAPSSTQWTKSTGVLARSTKVVSTGVKRYPHLRFRESEAYLKRLTHARINVQELMDTGRLEVPPWTDICDFKQPREHSWVSRSQKAGFPAPGTTRRGVFLLTLSSSRSG